MARTFDGVDDEIETGLGALGFAFGPGTMVVLVKRAADGVTHVPLDVGAVTNPSYRFLVLSTNVLRLTLNSAVTSDSTLTLTVADGWALIAVAKATGTATPRFHKYVFSTNTWTHQNGSAAIANSGVPTGKATLGRTLSDTAPWNGDIAAAGVWDVVLTDAQIEQLAFSLVHWFQVQPKALWLLDQHATTQNVPDLSGGGANQTALTGTTVSTSSVPVFKLHDGAIRVQAVTAGPTTHLGSASLTVTAAVATAGVRTTHSTAVLPLTLAVATTGTRTTTSTALLPLTAAVAATGTRTTFATATLPLVVGIGTQGVTGGIKLGTATLTVTAAIQTAGTRTAVSAAASTYTASIATAAARTTFATVTLTETLAVQVGTARTTFATVSLPVTATITVASHVGVPAEPIATTRTRVDATSTRTGTSTTAGLAGVDIDGGRTGARS